MKKVYRPFLLLPYCASFLALGGCDTVRHTLGLDHYQPDEFSVSGNPPLSMPPDYNLAPPKPGQPDRGYVPEKVQAQQKLYGQPVKLDSASSKEVEQRLISSAAKDATIDHTIRQKVNAEAEDEQTVLQRLANLKNKAIKNLTLAEDADVKPGSPNAVTEAEGK